MKIVLTLALVACVAAFTRACCTPDQWEGFQVSKSGYTKGWFHKGMINEFSTVAYDATNKRTAVTLDYKNGRIDAKLKMITIFPKGDSDVNEDCGGGKKYIIDLKKNKCYERRTYCKDFHKLCIPAEAKGKEFYLGLEGVFKVKAYNFKKEWRAGKWHHNSLVADITVNEVAKGVCAPVGEQLVGHMYGLDFIQNIAFVNIKPGINDTSVFDIPKICEESLDMSLMEEIPERGHFTMAL